MPGNETYELAVAIEPTGTRETEQQLDSIEESFDETADTAEDSAADMEQFAEKWKGTLQIAAGALTAATGTILSRVPVIQEGVASLDMVLTSLALKLNEDLKPALEDVNEGLQETSREIDEADSSGEAFVDTAAGLGEAFGNLHDAADDVAIDIAAQIGGVALDRIRQGDVGDASALAKGFLDFMFPAQELVLDAAGDMASDAVTGISNKLAELDDVDLLSVFPSSEDLVSVGDDIGGDIMSGLRNAVDDWVIEYLKGGPPERTTTDSGVSAERKRRTRDRLFDPTGRTLQNAQPRSGKQRVRDRLLDPTGKSLQGHTTKVTLETDTQELESEVKDTFGDALGHRGRLIR